MKNGEDEVGEAPSTQPLWFTSLIPQWPQCYHIVFDREAGRGWFASGKRGL